MSENKVSFKLKNKSTFFSDIFWFEQYWRSYNVETRGAHTLLGTVIRLFIPASVCLLVLAQNLRWLTLMFSLSLLEHTLCLVQLCSCLVQPLYTCTRTNLRVSYSGQICGWSEITFILTNEGPSNITRLICIDQSQVLELTQADKEQTDKGPASWILGPTYTAYRVGQKYVRAQKLQALALPE